MKVSIITVHNTINYGSILQTLATQHFFDQQGFSVEFIDYWRKDQVLSNRIASLYNRPAYSIKQKLKKGIYICLAIKSYKKQNKIFRNFIHTYINITDDKYFSYDDIVAKIPEADIYCTGSDQMWNSSWNQGIEKSFFLEYTPLGKRRISYSTSIGKTEFSEGEAEQTIALLKKYDLITVREQSTVKLLEKYGIKSLLVLDPTLMFGYDYWKRYINKRFISEKYLLVYQLHLQHDNANFKNLVNQIASEKKLKVVSIEYSYTSRRCWNKIFIPSIENFLSLFYYADYIVTDSFHGTAFSINFNKQFASIYPKEFSTRIDNILDLCALKSRRIDDKSKISNCLENIDYTYANKRLSEERVVITNRFQSYFKTLGE